METIKCPQCSKEINPSRYTYCNTCFVSLFQPSSQKKMRAALYSITFKDGSTSSSTLEKESKHEEAPPDLIHEPKPPKAGSKFTPRNIAIIIFFILSLAFGVYRILPYLFPEQMENKKLLVAANMVIVQGMILSYEKKNKQFPETMSMIISKNFKIPDIINPFSRTNAEGEAWGDYKKFGGREKAGMVIYKFVSKTDYEIYGYIEDSKPLQKDGKPIVLKPSSKVLKPEELI